LFIVHLPLLLIFKNFLIFIIIKIKEHFTLKTTMFDIIMFRQTIFVILTQNIFIYALHTCSFHTVLIARDSVEGKYNTVHQSNISIAATIEMRAFFIIIFDNDNNNSDLVKLLKPVKYF